MAVAALLLAIAIAFAQEPPPEPSPESAPAPEPEPTPEPEATAGETPTPSQPSDEGIPVGEVDLGAPTARWGGIVIPLVTFNSTDGLALGVGGEVFERGPPPGETYRRKFTFQALVSVDGEYHSHLIRYDTRTGRHDVLGEIGFHLWKSHLYAGTGADDVTLDRGDREGGNRGWSPYVTVGATQPLGPGLVYQQVLVKYMDVEPAEGSVLQEQAPTGFLGGWYFDATAGWYVDRFDRWPLPDDGLHVEIDGRVGGALVDDQDGFLPQGGVHFEAIRWWPVLAPWLVIGTRATGAYAFGDRPFFEAEFLGGRRRAEMGYDKSLTGYGRTRTRAPGALATLVEIRTFFYRTNHKFFDVGFYASFFAEEAFLFDRDGTGPHMPTLGVGPVILWQGATMLRPFIAWGWRTEDPDDPRRPMPQFGLTLTDPL